MSELFTQTEYEKAIQQLKPEGRCFINGNFVATETGETYENFSPINDHKINDVALGKGQDINYAVRVARTTFENGIWRNTTPKHKMKVLRTLGELVEENAQELALLETLDTGKPIRFSSKIDIHHLLDTIEYYQGSIDKIYGQIANTAPHAIGMITREPIGVVGAITPWNFPMMMAGWKIIPALATGNSVVLKPAEQTPLTALKIAALATEAGIPPGVLNVVPGFGEAGKSLGLHPNVDAISFTGSTEVAKLLLQYAGQSNMKRVSAETGGKSPNIIFEDAYDVEYAAKQAAFSIFFNSGAMCVAGARLLVQESIQDQVIEWLIEMTKKLVPAHPLDSATRLGPVIDQNQFDKIKSYIEIGQAEGATLVYGGKQVLSQLGKCYIEPTIFKNVTNAMKIAREEIFGPVVSIIPFKDEAEALEIANDTIYGLNAGIWTKDLGKAHRMAKGIQAGTIWVNNWEGSDYSTSFGGFKQSGFGGKDKSMHALDKYTNIKTTWIHIDGAGAR
jgi:acyl-CoA reductase-like NAD-dependent aldehyde dehydrogenase